MSLNQYMFEAELLKQLTRALDILERMTKRLEEIEEAVSGVSGKD